MKVIGITFDAATAHPQAAGVGFQRRLAGELITCQIPENMAIRDHTCQQFGKKKKKLQDIYVYVMFHPEVDNQDFLFPDKENR